MKSWEQIEKELVPLLERCWASLGAPAVSEAIDEEESGIIDPESAMLLTLSFGQGSRLWADIPAWVERHVDLINFQKLSTLRKVIPTTLFHGLRERFEGTLFQKTPERFRRLFHLSFSTRDDVTMKMRVRKLLPISEVAKRSLMIRNRLLFGTGYRADLVSVLMADVSLQQGRQVAHLLAAANSTVSRIMKDLSDCDFIDAQGSIKKDRPQLPGLFLSTDSLRNLVAIFQAREFSFDALREQVINQADLRFDGLTRQLLNRVP